MCKRCGQCCASNRDLWKESNLTKKQFDMLEKLLNLPCRALDIIDGVPTCRVQLHFGYNAKPDRCKGYHCKEQGNET